MLGKFKVAHLCGMAKEHEEEFKKCEEVLTLAGYICFRPVFYDLEMYNNHKEMIDEMCDMKLIVCDILVVVTPEHIGKRTKEIIDNANRMGKKVAYWNKYYNELSSFDYTGLIRSLRSFGDMITSIIEGAYKRFLEENRDKED